MPLAIAAFFCSPAGPEVVKDKKMPLKQRHACFIRDSPVSR